MTTGVSNLTLPQRQNIYEPIVMNAPVLTGPGRDNPPQDSTDVGLYGYDTIGITSKLKLLLGVRRVQDKEVNGDIGYEINCNWKINAAMLRLKAVQDSPSQPLVDGKVPENTPKWNANLGVSWRVPAVAGLTIRAGTKHVAKRPVNPENQGYIPAVTLYDAGVSYATRIASKRASFTVSIDNLANKRYWNSVQTGTHGIGMDRSIKFTSEACAFAGA